MRFTAISSSMPQAQVHLSSIIYHLFINHLCRQAKSSSIIYHLFIYNLCGLPQLVHLCRRQKVHLSSIIYYLCRRHKSIYHLLSIIYLSTIYAAGTSPSIIYYLSSIYLPSTPQAKSSSIYLLSIIYLISFPSSHLSPGYVLRR